MIDKKKVATALECLADGQTCACCDYKPYDDCTKRVARDTLVLLKEQEAVEPKTEPSAKGYWYTCGACGWWLFEVRDTVHFDDRKRIHFCASCGRSVKWE